MSQISTLFAFIILFISYCSYLQASRARDDGYYQRQYGTCRYGEHVVGKWVYNANLTREDKSFYCCGWDNNDFLYNMPMCGFASMQGWQNLMTGQAVMHALATVQLDLIADFKYMKGKSMSGSHRFAF